MGRDLIELRRFDPAVRRNSFLLVRRFIFLRFAIENPPDGVSQHSYIK